MVEDSYIQKAVIDIITSLFISPQDIDSGKIDDWVSVYKSSGRSLAISKIYEYCLGLAEIEGEK